ncbi:winged helix-turn-helix transcriptional regulator [bacterium]|nr:winged helix-turn-helix transcriptional regulator [bacterium]
MEKQLFELIMMVKKKCLRTEEKIRTELKLTPGEFHGLLAIEEGEKVPGLAFSERMDFSPSRGSRILNRLVTKKYMVLNPGRSDRRSIEASLTPGGVHMRAIIFSKMTDCETRITSQLSREDVRDIKSALTKLASVM